MKAKNLGRLELLAWLNDIIDADYPKIENCSDGIAYCQLLDYLCPNQSNVIQLNKLNYMAKNKADNQRNLKLFQTAVKKLNLPFTVPNIEQLSNGKFQFNMECVQWLYDYSIKLQSSKNQGGGPGPASMYPGYQKRQEAVLKQLQAKGMYMGIDTGENFNSQMPLSEEMAHQYMNPHLIPTKMTWNIQENSMDVEQNMQPMGNLAYGMPQQVQNFPSNYGHPPAQSFQFQQPQAPLNPLTPEGVQQIDTILSSLEEHLHQQLKNHKLFLDDIQSIEEERNFYYRKLRLIEDQCQKFSHSKDCQARDEIMAIISSVPEDFLQGQGQIGPMDNIQQNQNYY